MVEKLGYNHSEATLELSDYERDQMEQNLTHFSYNIYLFRIEISIYMTPYNTMVS